MIVRVIEFLNSFYRDVQFENEIFTNTQYCTLGYFDGMRTESLGSFFPVQDKEAETIRDKLYAYIVKNLDGQNSERNVICFIDDEDKDKKFWNEKERALLFVSLIRLKNSSRESFEELRNNINKINKEEENRIIYYSTDHCEIVVINKISSYRNGIECIKQLHEDFDVFKMYSLLAIDEGTLDSETELKNKIEEDERINCRLHISVNWNLIKESEEGNSTNEKLKKNIEQFCTAIKDKLNITERWQFTMCNKLGSSDIIVEVNDILLFDLLKCYRKKNPLRHSSTDYNRRWFNIETELFLDKEVINIG